MGRLTGWTLPNHMNFLNPDLEVRNWERLEFRVWGFGMLARCWLKDGGNSLAKNAGSLQELSQPQLTAWQGLDSDKHKPKLQSRFLLRASRWNFSLVGTPWFQPFDNLNRKSLTSDLQNCELISVILSH